MTPPGCNGRANTSDNERGQMDVTESLKAFVAAEKRQGIPPSVREFASELGVTSTPAFRRLQLLERDGFLARVEGRRYQRNWEITPKGRKALT